MFGQAPGRSRSRPASSWACPGPSRLTPGPAASRGVALWRVGQTSYLVEHDLSAEEKALADTDGAMRAGPVADAGRPGAGSRIEFGVAK